MPFAYFFTESEGFAGSRKVSGGYINHLGRKQNSTQVVQLKRFHFTLLCFYLFNFNLI